MIIVGDVAAAGGREAALALHRDSNLDDARTEYERLLASSPEDADLLGLLGVLALQQQHPAKAADLLAKAINTLTPDPRVHLRNVNNLFALLHEQGHPDAARELASAELPNWPKNTPPSASERTMVLSVIEALAIFGQAERALALLESVLTYFGEDAEALILAGWLGLKCEDPQAALSDLQRACLRDPDNWQALANLSIAYDAVGDHTAARKTAERCARAAPVSVASRRDGHQAGILVLNRSPTRIENADRGLDGLHFTKNYIAQASRLMTEEYRFVSVFADSPEPLPALPDTDIVFNKIASGEDLSLPGLLDRVVGLVEGLQKPVINHPRAVFQMTRQKAADLLQGISGLRVPGIARYWRDIDRFDEIEANIDANFAYPVIVRHVAADESLKSLLSEKKTAILVNDAGERRSFLETVTWDQFYVVEYVNLRKADGNFRRIRAAFFPDDIIITACGFYSEWMVAGWRTNKQGHAFYDAFPQRVIDMQRTLRDPEAMLGAQFMPVLRTIRQRVPLDVFAMDFDLDDDGEVVLFEAQATMILLMPRDNVPDHLQLPRELDDRVNGAFRRLVRQKIAQAA
jgi:Flp pilus assembly protein TadD